MMSFIITGQLVNCARKPPAFICERGFDRLDERQTSSKWSILLQARHVLPYAGQLRGACWRPELLHNIDVDDLATLDDERTWSTHTDDDGTDVAEACSALI